MKLDDEEGLIRLSKICKEACNAIENSKHYIGWFFLY